jgi:hypothetical protein
MKVIFAALFFGWMMGLSAFGQEKNAKVADPDTSPLKNVSVQLEYIDVPHKDLTRLLMEHKPTTSDATALRMKVQEMVEKDTAKVMETKIMTVRYGQKASNESHNELCYPIDFDPPGHDFVMPAPEKDGFRFTNAMPTAWETRNIGSSLEVEANLAGNSKLVDVRINANYTWHTSDSILYESKDSFGNIYKTTSPNIYKLGIETSATVVTGQYFLAGVVSPKDAKGQVDSERKIMLFLKCDALSVVP